MEINISGINYLIKETEIFRDRGQWAEIDYINQTIAIDKNISPERATVAIIHEMLHGFFEVSGFEKENENEHLIQNLSIGMYQMLINNKRLLTRLLGL